MNKSELSTHRLPFFFLCAGVSSVPVCVESQESTTTLSLRLVQAEPKEPWAMSFRAGHSHVSSCNVSSELFWAGADVCIHRCSAQKLYLQWLEWSVQVLLLVDLDLFQVWYYLRYLRHHLNKGKNLLIKILFLTLQREASSVSHQAINYQPGFAPCVISQASFYMSSTSTIYEPSISYRPQLSAIYYLLSVLLSVLLSTSYSKVCRYSATRQISSTPSFSAGLTTLYQIILFCAINLTTVHQLYAAHYILLNTTVADSSREDNSREDNVCCQ